VSADIAAHAPQPKPPSAPRLFVVMALTVAIWSINYTVGKVGFHYMRPLALGMYRVVIASVTMLPVAIWCAVRQRRAEAAGTPTLLKRIQPADLFNFACLGFFGIFVNQGLFTIGLSMTSVGRSAIVVATTPIFILLAAWMLRMEHLTLRKVIGLALAFVGAVVLGAGREWNLSSTGSLGDLLTLIASLAVVIFTILGKRMAKSYDALQLMAYNVTLAGLFALPIATWQAWSMIRTGEWGAIGWQGWAAAAYMGILSSALCIPLYFWVLRWLPPSKIGALSYLQPVVGTPFAALVLGEPMTGDLLSGGVLILAGVYAIESDRSASELHSRS
jgi:drug/metabolite transporter (DMT)-like permease